MGSAQEQLLQMVAEMRERTAGMKERSRQISQFTASNKSKDRMISVEVDSRGRLVRLAFHNQRYRDLPAADLANRILQTVQQAQDDVFEKTMSSINEFKSTSLTLLGVDTAKLDADSMFDTVEKIALGLDAEPIQETGRREGSDV